MMTGQGASNNGKYTATVTDFNKGRTRTATIANMVITTTTGMSTMTKPLAFNPVCLLRESAGYLLG
jgi:hypothetical protein